MAENFPSLEKETDTKVQESQRVPKKMNTMRLTPRSIIISVKAKDKERLLKPAREENNNKHLLCTRELP